MEMARIDTRCPAGNWLVFVVGVSRIKLNIWGRRKWLVGGLVGWSVGR